MTTRARLAVAFMVGLIAFAIADLSARVFALEVQDSLRSRLVLDSLPGRAHSHAEPMFDSECPRCIAESDARIAAHAD